MATPRTLLPNAVAPAFIHVHCPACLQDGTVALPTTWVRVDLDGWQCSCGAILEVHPTPTPEEHPTVH